MRRFLQLAAGEDAGPIDTFEGPCSEETPRSGNRMNASSNQDGVAPQPRYSRKRA